MYKLTQVFPKPPLSPKIQSSCEWNVIFLFRNKNHFLSQKIKKYHQCAYTIHGSCYFLLERQKESFSRGGALFQSSRNIKLTDACAGWCHEVRCSAIPSRKSAARWEAGEQYYSASASLQKAGVLWWASSAPGLTISLDEMFPEPSAGWASFLPFTGVRTAAQSEDSLQNIPPLSLWDSLGPGTLCCSAAVLAPGQTSPWATKYKETIRD